MKFNRTILSFFLIIISNSFSFQKKDKDVKEYKLIIHINIFNIEY